MTTQPFVERKEFRGVRMEVKTPLSFDEVLRRLHSLTGHTSIPEIVALAKTAGSEADYVHEIEDRFVGESGFMLFSEIDHGGWIGRFGIRRRALRWILGNPLIAITMLRHDIAAGLFAPVELLLAEQVGGEGSILFYVRPSSLIAMGEDAELRTAAEALDVKFEALIARATSP